MIAALSIIGGSMIARGVEPTSRVSDADAYDLGRKVLAIQGALANPVVPEAIDAVKALGQDSRYYVMVRGWLSMQLSADQSIASARGDDVPGHIRERIEFLERAIRAIDLE